jgi:hypothetical protein
LNQVFREYNVDGPEGVINDSTLYDTHTYLRISVDEVALSKKIAL